MSRHALVLSLLVGCVGDKPNVDTGGVSSGLADEDGDGFDESEDCDDNDASVNAGATEICDGIDNDCDDEIDEGVLDTWYADTDGDGYGDPATAVESCDGPADHVPNATDCDDTNADVFPAAIELCDGIDNNCDGQIDEGVQETWYVDADGDGYGDAGSQEQGCEAPSGTVADATDCDDTNAEVNPGTFEVCDDVDNDCDGFVDEDDATDAAQWYADVDGDGYGDPDSFTYACDTPTGYVDGARDCDDLDPDVRPDAPEVCDSIDNDCDGLIDDADPGVDVSAGGTWYTDGDGDGYGDAAAAVSACLQPSGTVTDTTDCDDTSAAVNPGATEVCNSIDDDCDGDIDDADSGVDLSTGGTWYTDSDGDGYGDASSTVSACAQPSGAVSDTTDCDDSAAAVNPGATEVCNSIDDDCDGDIDDADSSVDLSTGTTWYSDSDSDGYGDATSTVSACAQPSGTVTDATDCDDGTSAVNPAATEICNGIDDDCDNDVDDDDSSVDLSTASTWYEDGDGDGYGATGSTLDACSQPSGYEAVDGDCDDTDTAYNPGAALGCDGEDYDCDGNVDNDGDLDGYAADTCGGSDCDDTDASIRPDSTGDCALGLVCDDILDMGRSTGDGFYTIDPDGYGTGLDPFEVYCDMTTDGGGWTEIAYADDVAFQQWYSGGDGWRYFSSDFSFELSDTEIAAIQALSVEGGQIYEGRCEHVIHYYYAASGNYSYAFGFMFFDGTETPRGQSSYAPYDITVTSDGCASNGGEGGSLSQTTDFFIDSPLVPVLNVQCRDCGDAFPEQLGSNLTDNSAWLR